MRLLKSQTTNFRSIKGQGVKVNTELEVEIDSNKAVMLPSGTTIDRPSSPKSGQIRYNIDNKEFEGYTDNWGGIGGSSSSGGPMMYWAVLQQ